MKPTTASALLFAVLTIAAFCFLCFVTNIKHKEKMLVIKGQLMQANRIYSTALGANPIYIRMDNYDIQGLYIIPKRKGK